MKTETNKGKILDILFDYPKTTAELAHELGYVNSEGIARYNIINKDLKRLVESKYLKSEKVKKERKSGNTPTLYSIDFNIQNLRGMIEEYPHLISKMKKNDSALKVVSHEHLNLMYYYSSQNKEEYQKFELYNLFINLNKEKQENHNQIEFFDSFNKICEEKLKKRLELSNEFFKFFLINNTNKLTYHIEILAKTFDENLSTRFYKKDNSLDDKVAIFDYILKQLEMNKKDNSLDDKVAIFHYILKQLEMNKKDNSLDDKVAIFHYILKQLEMNKKDNSLGDKVTIFDYILLKQREMNFGLDVAFKACVIKDIIDDQSSTDAIEYMKQMENEASNEQISHLKSYLESTKFLPVLLKEEKLTSVNNSKIKDVG